MYECMYVCMYVCMYIRHYVVLVLDFILHHRFCFSFAFRFISTSLHGLYTRHPKQQYCDQGQLKRKSVRSNEVALCENKTDWALAVEFSFYRAKYFGI